MHTRFILNNYRITLVRDVRMRSHVISRRVRSYDRSRNITAPRFSLRFSCKSGFRVEICVGSIE